MQQNAHVMVMPPPYLPRSSLAEPHRIRTAVPASRTDRGATLIEVLVALLILAVGLLGIASLYVDNLQSGRTAVLRTQAAGLAADMAERIRTQRTAGVVFGPVTGWRCNETAEDSSPAAAVANEVACWQEEVAATLPNGTGTVARDTTTVPVSYTVTVSWSETGAGTASYVIRVQS